LVTVAVVVRVASADPPLLLVTTEKDLEGDTLVWENMSKLLPVFGWTHWATPHFVRVEKRFNSTHINA
jgi:hypothetical protein